MCPSGATPPMANPVCSRTKSASARLHRHPQHRRHLRRIDPVGAGGDHHHGAIAGAEDDRLGDLRDRAADRRRGIGRGTRAGGKFGDRVGVARRQQCRAHPLDQPSLARHAPRIVAMIAAMEPLALYIHWPFCLRQVPVLRLQQPCARAHRPGAASPPRCARSWRWEAARLGRRPLVSIFFGGGTPSLMEPATVAALIADAAAPVRRRAPTSRSRWRPTRPASRPAASPPSAHAGVNRVSLGVQSLDDAALPRLGREHSARAGDRGAGARARRLFPRLSFDLIYARPGQTDAGVAGGAARRRWRSRPTICRSTNSPSSPAPRFEALHRARRDRAAGRRRRRRRCTTRPRRKPRASAWLPTRSPTTPARRGEPAQPRLLALRRLRRHRARRAWAGQRSAARCSPRAATARRSPGPSASSAHGHGTHEETPVAARGTRARDAADGPAADRGHRPRPLRRAHRPRVGGRDRPGDFPARWRRTTSAGRRAASRPRRKAASGWTRC